MAGEQAARERLEGEVAGYLSGFRDFSTKHPMEALPYAKHILEYCLGPGFALLLAAAEEAQPADYNAMIRRLHDAKQEDRAEKAEAECERLKDILNRGRHLRLDWYGSDFGFEFQDGPDLADDGELVGLFIPDSPSPKEPGTEAE